MKRLVFSGFLVFAGGLFAACGGDTHAPPIPDQVVGSSGAGGKGAGARPGVGGHKTLDAGSEDGGDADPTGSGGTGRGDAGASGPVVIITAPEASTDPNASYLADPLNKVTVVCNVVQSDAPGAKAVDASSVTLEMLDATGTSLSMPAVPAVQSQSRPSDFSADFIYTTVPNGKVFFRCNAKDRSGVASSATIGTFVDQGPNVKINSPAPKAAVPATTLTIDFTAEQLPLAPKGDNGAAVDSVTLSVGGQSIDISSAEVGPGHYNVGVNLQDKKLFPMTLNGTIAIALSATDKRGVTRTVNSTVIVDSEAPQIAITSPRDGDIIGGTTYLTFTVNDSGSGVDQQSVAVTVNGEKYPFKKGSSLWSVNSGTYTFALFGTKIDSTTVQVNVTITASDIAQNTKENGASATYYLDTTRPLLDLDPPLVEERRPKSPSGHLCSAPFDVLGRYSVSDGDRHDVLQTDQPLSAYIRVRALVYDEPNTTPGSAPVVFYYAGIDQTTPKLYIQSDAAAGLLVDTDMDTICDDVATADATVTFANLYPVSVAGSADFEPGYGISDPDPTNSKLATCESGTDSGPPQPLCNGSSDLTRIIGHEQFGGGAGEPVVYSLQDDDCRVPQLDLKTVIASNGWVCLAVRARDKAGNLGISAPLRACINDLRLGAAPKCWTDPSDPPPSCTRNCTAPPHFGFRQATTARYIDQQ